MFFLLISWLILIEIWMKSRSTIILTQSPEMEFFAFLYFKRFVEIHHIWIQKYFPLAVNTATKKPQCKFNTIPQFSPRCEKSSKPVVIRTLKALCDVDKTKVIVKNIKFISG